MYICFHNFHLNFDNILFQQHMTHSRELQFDIDKYEIKELFNNESRGQMSDNGSGIQAGASQRR